MNTDRKCGCKGIRSCIVCETEYGIPEQDKCVKQLLDTYKDSYDFDIQLQALIKHSDDSDDEKKVVKFPGIRLIPNFISEQEESKLLHDLDELPWDSSQSGRRKQNFGPRANFKKRKTKAGNFAGFPVCTKFIQDRFSQVPCLQDYRTVEQCSIEYRTETGACIEPHIDDCWIWGERIVQLNLMSDSFLTLTPYTGPSNKYNLADVPTYPKILDEDGRMAFNPFKEGLAKDSNGHPFLPRSCLDQEEVVEDRDPWLNGIVRIPLPRRSLLIMYGQARYNWEHFILREDIKSRRIVIAYREFTPTYLPGGQEQQLGKMILQKASQFWTTPDDHND